MVKKQFKKSEKVLLWVPCLNSEKNIILVLDRIRKLDFNYHILLIDNHSTDNTIKLARDYITQYNLSCTIVKNIRNMDYGGSNKIAWWYGINNGFDYMIVLHSDGQYPIEYSGKMLRLIKETNCDFIIGSRTSHQDVKKFMPAWRILGNKSLSSFNRWAYNLEITDFFSEFKIYNLKFMEKIDIDKLHNGVDHQFTLFIQFIKHKAKFKEISIPCSYHKTARHPSFKETVVYVLRDLYRGLRYKIFKR